MHNVDGATFNRVLRVIDDLYLEHLDVTFAAHGSATVTALASEICESSPELGTKRAIEDGDITPLHIDSCGGHNVFRDAKYITDQSAHVPTNVRMHTGTGRSETCHSYGPYAFEVMNKAGEWIRIDREGYFLPTFEADIFSINRDRRLYGTEIIPSDNLSKLSALNHDTLKIDGHEIWVSNSKDISRVNIRPVQEDHPEMLSTAPRLTMSADVELWHRRLAHMPPLPMSKLSKLTVGCNIYVPSRLAVTHRNTCDVCVESSMKKAPESKSAPGFEKASEPGELVYSDLLGPLPESINANYSYAAVFIDAFSSYISVYPMRYKNDLERNYQQYEADMAPYFKTFTRRFHSDNGGEFINNSLAEFLRSNEVRHTKSAPYAPNQNTIAEQAMWKLCTATRAMLLESGMPPCHWAQAMVQAANVINVKPKLMHRAGSTVGVMPPTTREAKKDAAKQRQSNKVWTTAFYRLKGYKPHLANFKVFGCRAYLLKEPIKGRKKLESLAEKGWLIGPARYARGFIIFVPAKEGALDQGTYRVSRNIRVNEYLLPKGAVGSPTSGGDNVDKDTTSPAPVNGDPPRVNAWIGGHTDPSTVTWAVAADGGQGRPQAPSETPSLETPSHTTSPSPEGVGAPNNNTNSVEQGSDNDEVCALGCCCALTQLDHMQMHVSDRIDMNEWIDNDDIDSINAFVTLQKMVRGEGPDELQLIDIPKSCQDAFTGPYKHQWLDSFKDELESFRSNNAMTIEDVPPGHRVIDPVVVRDIKRKEDLTPARFKTRLCARGFMQIYGEHYYNTFSNTVRYETLRQLLSVAAALNLELSSLDIKTAYLYGIIEPGVKLYLRFPSGWEFLEDGPSWTFKYTGDHKKTRGRPEKAFRLWKAMYGLKQGGAAWEEELSQFLSSLGAERSVVDPCLWRYAESGQTILFAVYVDDIVMACSSQAFRDTFVKRISERYALRDNGPLTWIFGSTIKQDLEAGTVQLHQRMYTAQVVQEFLTKKPAPSRRVVPCTEDISNLTPLEEGEMIHPQYAALVGKLGWLATISRPDIALAHSLLSKFVSAGGERHFKCAIGVVEYLAKTSSKALTYRRDATGELNNHILEYTELREVDVNPFTPKIFPDASHGGEKPQAGFCIYQNEDLVSWHSGRLRSTPISTAEGEWDIATKAVQTGIALSDTETFMLEKLPDFLDKHSVKELGLPMPVYCDNKAAVLLSDGNTSSKRMKHVATKIAFLREQVKEAKRVYLYHIRTQGQLADLMTKPLAASIFHPLASFMIA